MALDDADRRSLEEIERQLTLETPKLAKTLGKATPPRQSVVPEVPTAVATVILLAAFAWMSAMAGSLVPLMLAFPFAVAAVSTLVWQRSAPPLPARDGAATGATNRAGTDGPPTWWFT
jgi:hypothetical protein